MTIAQQIAELPFYQACREADQLAVRIKDIGNDTIWKFADGSQLTSFILTTFFTLLYPLVVG